MITSLHSYFLLLFLSYRCVLPETLPPRHQTSLTPSPCSPNSERLIAVPVPAEAHPRCPWRAPPRQCPLRQALAPSGLLHHPAISRSGCPSRRPPATTCTTTTTTRNRLPCGPLCRTPAAPSSPQSFRRSTARDETYGGLLGGQAGRAAGLRVA